ncbi:penicillin-binding transpeptidase domain-containing protein [Ruegeria sp.]|uniref:penicillin-binding transpeptidase domain-containing protein n=1 Tax=Ruegeria sp. TaxID=1879320 RepID=UPI003C7BA358
MRQLLHALSLAALVSSISATSHADTGCTLVRKIGKQEPTYHAGELCESEFAPASTFKLPLALMGFEMEVLQSPDEPKVEYDPAVKAPYKNWQQATTPQTWLRYSVIWYSQWLTQQLGENEFQRHVDKLNYGNRDLMGTPGKNDGLTQAWLSTSLKITPRQQSEFLMRLVSRELPYSANSMDQTVATTQEFEAAGDLLIKGKTGNAWATDASSNRLKEQHGWFVGWLSHNGAQYVFVHLIVEDGNDPGFSSTRARKQVLANISKWIDGD